jgi:hypothetical protein
MPRCLNCPPPPAKGYYYSGDEKTPLGRGYSAKFISEGETMKGKDRKNYVSQNGRWNLVTKKSLVSPNRKHSPRGRLYKTWENMTLEEEKILYTCRLYMKSCSEHFIKKAAHILKINKNLTPGKAMIIQKNIDRFNITTGKAVDIQKKLDFYVNDTAERSEERLRDMVEKLKESEKRRQTPNWWTRS